MCVCCTLAEDAVILKPKTALDGQRLDQTLQLGGFVSSSHRATEMSCRLR